MCAIGNPAFLAANFMTRAILIALPVSLAMWAGIILIVRELI